MQLISDGACGRYGHRLKFSQPSFAYNKRPRSFVTICGLCANGATEYSTNWELNRMFYTTKQPKYYLMIPQHLAFCVNNNGHLIITVSTFTVDFKT